MARHQLLLKKSLIFKLASTSNLLENTGSELSIGISPAKHQIEFMVTLLLISRAQSFERDQFRMNPFSDYKCFI